MGLLDRLRRSTRDDIAGERADPSAVATEATPAGPLQRPDDRSTPSIAGSASAPSSADVVNTGIDPSGSSLRSGKSAPIEAAWSWLAPGTFHCGDREVFVVGEAHYQANIEAVAGGRTELGPSTQYVTAMLVAEPTNRYDRDAVRVEVGGLCVGYIARDGTMEFHPILRQLAGAGRPATCRARLTGGWDRGGGDVGHFGVVLEVRDGLRLVEDGPPMLPFGRGRVSLVGEEACQEVLEALLRGTDRAEVIALVRDDGVAVTATVGDDTIGRLTPAMAARYRPWLAEYASAGYVDPRCEARVIRSKKKVEAFLKLAKP